MSILSPDVNGHLTITAPGATALLQGGYTVGMLFRNLTNLSATLWYPYESDNFARTSLFFDSDMWVGFNSWDANLDITTQHWRWLVVSKAAGTTNPIAYAGEYTGFGGMAWQRASVNGAQNNFPAIDRFSIGDEFGTGFRGELAVIAAFTSQMTNAQIESIFALRSATILDANPNFFAHFPSSAGIGSAFQDIAGGGVETIRGGSWSSSADPPNFNFSLPSARTGRVKRWNGSSWNSYLMKRWNGSGWDIHPVKGYDGSSWVLGKSGSGTASTTFEVFDEAAIDVASYNDADAAAMEMNQFFKYPGADLNITAIGIYVPSGGVSIGATGYVGAQFNSGGYISGTSYTADDAKNTKTVSSTPLVAGWNWITLDTPYLWTDANPYALAGYCYGGNYSFNSSTSTVPITSEGVPSRGDKFELVDTARSWYGLGTTGSSLVATNARSYGIDIRAVPA